MPPPVMTVNVAAIAVVAVYLICSEVAYSAPGAFPNSQPWLPSVKPVPETGVRQIELKQNPESKPGCTLGAVVPVVTASVAVPGLA